MDTTDITPASPQPANRTKRFKRIFSISALMLLAVGLLVALVVYFVFVRSSPFDPEPVLSTSMSPAGSIVTIHRVERAEEMTVKLGEGESLWSRHHVGRYRSVGGSGVTLHYDFLYPFSREFSALTLDLSQPSLMIRASMLGPGKATLTGRSFYVAGSPDRFNPVMAWEQEVGYGRPSLNLNGEGDEPDVRIELEAGEDDWMTLFGPFHFKEREGTLFAARNVDWTRKTWNLRATFEREEAGAGDVVHFQIENPAPRAPEAWVPSPKPWVVETDEFSLEFATFNWMSSYRAFGHEVMFQPKPGGYQTEESFWQFITQVTDDLGNTGVQHLFPGTRFLKIEGEVRGTGEYRHALADCTTVGFFVWPERPEAMGAIELTLVDAPPFGMKAARMAPATGHISGLLDHSDDEEDEGEVMPVYEITLEAKGSNKVEPLHRREGALALLREGQEVTKRTAAGIVRGSMSHGTTSWESKSTFQFQFEKEDEPPRPGERLRLVATPPAPVIPFSFIIPREAVEEE